MARRGSCSFSTQMCVYLVFLIAVISAEGEECDKTKCPGPLAYYESLDCTPVYKEEGDCCAMEYNCDHLEKRSKNKCYVNGNEYEIGERLNAEDANPCDIECMCQEELGIARFVCAQIDCPFWIAKPGCYRRSSLSTCCPEEEVCPEKPEDKATCNVNGEIYEDGDSFTVDSDPQLNCICQPGYEGENVEPFCSKPKRRYCSPDFRGASDIFNKCAPVYYPTQSPQTSCSAFSRCQEENDVVISKNEDDAKSANTDEKVCVFGNMTMHLGDELNRATQFSCIQCICEVPPVPTCELLSNIECGLTEYSISYEVS